MIRLEWNALRVGDRVLVHRADPELPLQAGTVAIVETRGPSNFVGVSVADEADGRRVVRPNRLSVHSDPQESAEDCWRCTSSVGDVRGETPQNRRAVTRQ
jgi:hypothetical protein